jgi:CheY-like chemotaxis protein
MPPTHTSPPLPMRVLVIDDDAVLRELLSALLDVEGHTVITAESGEDALGQLRGGLAADILLTDVQLPGLTGPALAEQLRAAAPSATLLGMSGSEPAAAIRRSFDAFLLKPFSTEDFHAAVSAGTIAERNSGPRLPAEKAAPMAALDRSTYDRLAGTLQPAQLAELYTLTLEDAESRIQRLAEAHTQHDEETWRREAHALKGGCSMVGATELASLAARAEKGMEPTDESVEIPHPGDFVAAAKRLRSNLTERLSHIT